MSKSIMIEVDQITKSIMKSVQDEMYEGTRSSLEQTKDDIISAVESVKRMQKLTEDVVQRQSSAVEDQMMALRSELTRLHHLIQGISSGTVEQLKNVVQTIDERIEKSEQSLTSGFIHFEERHQSIANRLEQLDEEQKKHSCELASIQTDIIRKLEEQVQQQQQAFVIQEQLLKRLEILEYEVKRANVPLFKKLFGGGGYTS